MNQFQDGGGKAELAQYNQILKQVKSDLGYRTKAQGGSPVTIGQCHAEAKLRYHSGALNRKAESRGLSPNPPLSRAEKLADLHAKREAMRHQSSRAEKLAALHAKREAMRHQRQQSQTGGYWW